jgi:hypothetical protein
MMRQFLGFSSSSQIELMLAGDQSPNSVCLVNHVDSHMGSMTREDKFLDFIPSNLATTVVSEFTCLLLSSCIIFCSFLTAYSC